MKTTSKMVSVLLTGLLAATGALWVISRKGEKWGVEFRSLMTPSFEL